MWVGKQPLTAVALHSKECCGPVPYFQDEPCNLDKKFKLTHEYLKCPFQRIGLEQGHKIRQNLTDTIRLDVIAD